MKVLALVLFSLIALSACEDDVKEEKKPEKRGVGGYGYGYGNGIGYGSGIGAGYGYGNGYSGIGGYNGYSGLGGYSRGYDYSSPLIGSNLGYAGYNAGYDNVGYQPHYSAGYPAASYISNNYGSLGGYPSSSYAYNKFGYPSSYVNNKFAVAPISTTYPYSATGAYSYGGWH